MENRVIDYKVQKGEEGENYVNDILNKVLAQMDYTSITVRNKYLPYESLYGKYGYITAEYDFIVFTPFFIYIIEVKNESYSKHEYSNPLWELKDGTEVSNPITQNRVHKLVFCSELKVPLNKVITVEVLLEGQNCVSEKSEYVNDYVFDRNELYNNLLYLFSSESSKQLAYQKLHDSFIELIETKKAKTLPHVEGLKRTEKIETRMRTRLGYIPFHRTDIVKCDKCGTGKLVFRDFSAKINIRNSKQYALGCTNYGNGSVNCKGLIYFDEDKDKAKHAIAEFERISIEERNDWGEEQMNQTVLDEINALKKDNQKLYGQIEKLNSLGLKLKQKDYDINILNSRLNQVNDRLYQIDEENEKNKIELSQFKRLFGRFYIRSK